MNKSLATRWLFSLLLCAFLSSINTLFAKHILFDLGGVLLTTSKSYVIRKAGGFFPLLGFTLRHGNPRKALFKALSQCEPCMQHPCTCCDEDGNELPPLFCDFLCGIPSEEILEHLYDAEIDDTVLIKLAQCIFDPETLAASQRIIKQGERFVRACIEQGHDVYILSNWDAASFALLAEEYPEFFDLFSGIVISGDCHLLKPDPAIYRHLLDTFNLNPAECVFIDNQQENVDAADTLGIHGIYCSTKWNGSPDFKKVKKRLNDWIAEELTA